MVYDIRVSKANSFLFPSSSSVPTYVMWGWFQATAMRDTVITELLQPVRVSVSCVPSKNWMYVRAYMVVLDQRVCL
ncbi:hypothetical protein DPMN_073201 [Dreissena polymorpha]|uniref:Uncharacterized protein n=1 Tax=Dreissena polymorpha TaxID=45954 RepID=A0A9D4BYN3_DREPO|nr:hypothetical protein DPMN_073201 [Dreissena polymorpha]